MHVTTRGWGMLIGGALLAAAAAAMQSMAAARVAAIVLAVPLVSLIWTLLARTFAARRGLERTLHPVAWQVDAPGSVRLVPTGSALPPWSSLRERVPASLRRSSHGPHGYAVLPEVRGRHRLGPAILQRSDPLAIASWRVPIGGVTEVIVWPRIEPIDGDVLASALEATVPTSHGLPQRTLEDLSVREYRRGDDLHRVHWRSTARMGELMVRHDEPTTTRVLDVLLVLSEDADNVSEWAVTAAASIAIALLEQGFAIRVVTVADGKLVERPVALPADALDVFAVASPAADLGVAAVRVVQRSTSAGAIAVLDRPDAAVGNAVIAAGGLELSTALIVDPHGVAADVASSLQRSGWHVASSPGVGTVADAWRAREVQR